MCIDSKNRCQRIIVLKVKQLQHTCKALFFNDISILGIYNLKQTKKLISIGSTYILRTGLHQMVTFIAYYLLVNKLETFT